MASKEDERKFILECIELYKCLPALWNVKAKEYSNRTKKNEQYEKLLKKYQEKYPEADKSQLIKKLNSLRTNYRKELKRIKNSLKSGAGADDVVEPTLWYFQEMQFLQDMEIPCSSNNSIQIENGEEIGVEEDAEDSNIANTNNNVNAHGPPKKKLKRKEDSQDDRNKLISLACQRLQQPESEYEKLAHTWAAELQKMEPLQQVFSKKAINDVLFEGQMGTLGRDSVQINNNRFLTPSRTSTPFSPPPSSLTYASAPSPVTYQIETLPQNIKVVEINDEELQTYSGGPAHSSAADLFSQFN